MPGQKCEDRRGPLKGPRPVFWAGGASPGAAAGTRAPQSRVWEVVHVTQCEEVKLTARRERWSVALHDTESTFTPELSAVVGGTARYGDQISWKRKETEGQRQR